MKKLSLILAILVIAISNNVMAQNNPVLFGNNSKHIRVGVGINSYGMPVEASYDQGFKQNIFGVKKLNLGLGGYVGYYGNKETLGVWTDGQEHGYKYSHIIIGARGLFHYPLVPKIDTYAGLMLGYNIASASYYGNGIDPGNASVGGFAWGGIVGARYQFNKTWGIYAEAGYSISYLSFGLVYSL
ncbi:MAG: porin family protein [Bacteroidales bacterium]|jgi:hypothetical protein|nr:porin family protein [Bacteroidales bacterium]